MWRNSRSTQQIKGWSGNSLHLMGVWNRCLKVVKSPSNKLWEITLSHLSPPQRFSSGFYSAFIGFVLSARQSVKRGRPQEIGGRADEQWGG